MILFIKYHKPIKIRGRGWPLGPGKVGTTGRVAATGRWSRNALAVGLGLFGDCDRERNGRTGRDIGGNYGTKSGGNGGRLMPCAGAPACYPDGSGI